MDTLITQLTQCMCHLPRPVLFRSHSTPSSRHPIKSALLQSLLPHGPSSSVSVSPFASSSLTQSFLGLLPVAVLSSFPLSNQPTIQKHKSKLCVVAYTCNPSTWESGAERSRFQSQPQTQVPDQSEQHSKTMAQDKNKFKKIRQVNTFLD